MASPNSMKMFCDSSQLHLFHRSADDSDGMITDS